MRNPFHRSLAVKTAMTEALAVDVRQDPGERTEVGNAV